MRYDAAPIAARAVSPSPGQADSTDTMRSPITRSSKPFGKIVTAMCGTPGFRPRSRAISSKLLTYSNVWSSASSKTNEQPRCFICTNCDDQATSADTASDCASFACLQSLSLTMPASSHHSAMLAQNTDSGRRTISPGIPSNEGISAGAGARGARQVVMAIRSKWAGRLTERRRAWGRHSAAKHDPNALPCWYALAVP